MNILRTMRGRGFAAAALFFALYVGLGLFGQPVRRAIGQGMQLLTSLTGTEQIVLNYPCTVSCGTTTSTLAGFVRSNSLLFSQTVSSGDGTTTAEQTLASYSLPAGTLTVGSRLAIRAVFQTGADGNTKTMKVYFGATSASSGAVTGSAKITTVLMNVVQTATAAQTISTQIQNDATAVANALTLGTDTNATATIIKATGTNGSNLPNEIYLADFYVQKFGN